MRVITLTEEEAGQLLDALQDVITEAANLGYATKAMLLSEIRSKLREAPRETVKEVYAEQGHA